MKGNVYLFQALVGRFNHLLSFAARMNREGLSRTPLISATFISREATGEIILGIGHGMAENPNFAIDGFGTFEPINTDRIALNPDHRVSLCIFKPKLMIEPQLSQLTIKEKYWWGLFAKRTEVDTALMQTIIQDILERRFARTGDFSIPVGAANQAADLCLRAFFNCIVNALVQRINVVLPGLGTFFYDSKATGGISFDAAEQVLDAVRLHSLRKHKLPRFQIPKGFEIGLPPEPKKATSAELVKYLKGTLHAAGAPDEVLGTSAEILRRALRRQRSQRVS